MTSAMTPTVSSATVTATSETPVYISSGDEHLFGILTRAREPSNGTAVLLLHAGEQNLSCHRNRLWTRLARELAALGHPCLRLDFHGSGDSSGVLVDRDVHGQAQTDVRAAVDWLHDHVADRVVIVATCWGGLVALVTAAECDAVVRLGLVSAPLRVLQTGGRPDQRGEKAHSGLGTAIRSAARPSVLGLLIARPDYRGWLRMRVKKRLLRGVTRTAAPPPVSGRSPDAPGDGIFASLARRQVPVHALFGDQDRTWLALQAQGGLPTLGPAAEVLDISVTPVSVHGLKTLEAQRMVREHVLGWLAEDRAAQGTPAGRE